MNCSAATGGLLFLVSERISSSTCDCMLPIHQLAPPESGVAWILWFSVNIYSLNPFPFTNECSTKSQSLQLVAIKTEKSNENVAMFPSPPPFSLIPPIGARRGCHGDNSCWAVSDRSQERNVWEREHLKLKQKWWGKKTKQAVSLTWGDSIERCIQPERRK